MDFVRLEGEERVYDREAVLGRDTRSVFPSEASSMGKMDPDAAAAVVGSMQFVTESQLLELRAAGAGAQDTVPALKPLTEVLAEAKEAKEAAFQEQWKQMKTGKNRALDEDELEFINAVEGAKAAQEAAWEAEQDRELDGFREASKRRGEESVAAAAAARKLSGGAPTVGPKPKPAVTERRPATKRPMPPQMVRLRPPAVPNASSRQPIDLESERQKDESAGGEEGLTGLLGDYGSTSDSE